MPKIQRKTQKIFCNSADSDQLAVFGSMSTGTPVYSSDIEELQSNEAFDLGWDAATLEDKAPFMEEMNGVQYGLTYQIAYGLQEGIPEYDAATTYYIGSICKVLEDGKPVLYTSLTDNNIGNDPVNDSTNWERLSFGGGGLEIGDIGIAPLGIDETKGLRRYLNGQLIIQDQYVKFTEKLKTAKELYTTLVCTEEEWQTISTMSVGGQCGKFVIDDDAGTIRLPKIIMPIQGLTDLSKLAEIVEAGLPNITGGFTSTVLSPNADTSAYGAFAGTTTTGASPTGGGGSGSIDTFDASRSSSIYGKSNTVQQEQIQYPYFIQVATGAETEDNIINEIELNNPFSLLDYKFSEYELNNLSWLRSNGQWNSKATYPAVYELLLKIYNGTETKAGVSVKLTTETFTDYDFVLNTDDETFRLPLLNGNETNVDYSTNIETMTTGAVTTSYTAPKKGFITYACVGLGAGGNLVVKVNGNIVNSQSVSSNNYATDFNGELYVNKDDFIELTSTYSSSVNYIRFFNLVGNGSLYFYVGETVQNANLINAGRIEEKIASLIPNNRGLIASYSMMSNRYKALTLGATGSTYIAPANGWFIINKIAGSDWYYCALTNNNTGEYDFRADYRTSPCTPRVYARRGDVIKAEYNATGALTYFRFYYAEGNK